MTDHRLGRNIKLSRERIPLTQAGLAKRIGKKPSVVGAYERAEVEPPLSALQAIADATGVSLLDLLGIKLSPEDLVRALMDHRANCPSPESCESCQPLRGIVVGVLIPDGQPDD